MYVSTLCMFQLMCSFSRTGKLHHQETLTQCSAFEPFLLVIWTCRPVHSSHLILKRTFLIVTFWWFNFEFFLFYFKCLSWLEWILWVCCWNTLSVLELVTPRLNFVLGAKLPFAYKPIFAYGFMQLKCCLWILHCSSQTSKFVWHTLFTQIAQLLYWIELKPFDTKNGGGCTAPKAVAYWTLSFPAAVQAEQLFWCNKTNLVFQLLEEDGPWNLTYNFTAYMHHFEIFSINL